MAVHDVSDKSSLDLDNIDDLHTMALNRLHLVRLSQHLHPVVANVFAEMIDPDRHGRPAEISQVIARLEHHRELPDDLDLSAAYADQTAWQRGVLTTLRNRVFDTTRRNRALYFKPTASVVSLTEASVPLMINVDRITADDLFTWTSAAGDRLRAGKSVDIEQWCRLEETPHLAPTLDKLISTERKLRTESGHGRLRLIVAFLRWFDRESNEVVNSPLLIMPVDLTRRKGVRTRYTISATGDAAVNPILRFVFRQRFAIELPEFVDSDVATIRGLVDDLQAQVQRTDPAVRIDVIDKPRIDLLRRRAQLRVDNFRRRRARTQAATGRWRRTDHSYESADWRPLGLALYEQFVVAEELPLRQLAGAAPRARRPQSFSDTMIASEADAHRWEVDLCAVTLAMLGTRRTSLSRDYDELLSRADRADTFADTPFAAMFSPTAARGRLADVASISIDQRLVLPADDAQAKAVRQAVRGDSFIIQGPPGTGKSQTITNLIAALVADGKRVLFVCEKRAALDVVGHRLRQVGLGDLVAVIHDSQLDRKSFVMSLGETYNQWIDDGPPASGRRAMALAAVEQSLRPLDVLVAEVQRPRQSGQSIRELVERSVLWRSIGAEPARSADSHTPTVALHDWFGARARLDRVADALAGAGLSDVIGEHRCFTAAPAILAVSDPVATVLHLGRSVASAIDRLHQRLSEIADFESITIDDGRAVETFGPAVAGAARAASPRSLDPHDPSHLDLRATAQTLARQMQELASSTALTNWNSPLNEVDARAALVVAEKSEASFFKFLHGQWRSVKALVEESYNFAAHQVRPTITSVLRELVAHHEREGLVSRTVASALTAYGSADPEALVAMVDRYHTNPLFAHAVAHTDGHTDGITAEAQALVAVVENLLVDGSTTMGELAEVARDIVATSVAHESALVRWAELAAADPDLLRWLLRTRAPIASLELGLVDEELKGALAEATGSLRGGAEVDALVGSILDSYASLLDANAADVLDAVKQRFLARITHSDASMAGRSDDDKELKKRYGAGRRVLEREFTKKMRYRSIRELADGDTGLVVRDLRPIWLMSPLSVSDTLPLDDAMFDAVVFDEASQIPVEDAVPSIFRSKQVIVVGDRMQLPPTRFFSTADDADDGDDEIDVVDDGTRITLSLDADSFLTQADQALTSSLLTWHYRSRSESLIAYSNYAFYGGELATVPDRVSNGGERAELVVETAAAASAHVSELLSRPISFHRMHGAVYRNRTNDDEADYIAELVRELLRLDTGLTIGIVAFSQAQQGAIETSLGELSTIDSAFAEQLESERNRTEDGELLGLFVKNLENVQGDERDIIIMSVCYGPGDDGRVRMNFGPINQPGGERRLNVIFSRAKRHMAIVSSMHGHQITNTHNNGAAHLANFLTYAAAESIGATAHSGAILSTQQGDQTSSGIARSPIAAAIARRLQERLQERLQQGERDWRVDVDVGRSQFRLDVAIKVDDRYVLAVLVEPARALSAASRFVAEAGVLDAFGWHIVRVTPAEWWSTPDRVIERIDHALSVRTDT